MSEIVNIPDENFRNYILKKLNKPSYYNITKEDCENINEIKCTLLGIKSLDGIEYFINLGCLDCYGNELTNLDLSKNTKLAYLNCDMNQLITLDLSKNIELKTLWCNNNQLTSLDLSKNFVLIYLRCDNNQLAKLDLSKNKELKNLYYIDNIFNIELNNNIELINNYTAIIKNCKKITLRI